VCNLVWLNWTMTGRGTTMFRPLWHVWLSVFCGLLVFGIDLVSVWKFAHADYKLNHEQLETQLLLMQANRALQEYQRDYGHPPESLKALGDAESTFLGGERFVDGWQRPVQLVSEGAQCVVVSYGRDGVLGGVGLDCDLSSDDIWPSDANPTLHQFLFEMPSLIIVCLCLVWSVITSFSIHSMCKKHQRAKKRLVTRFMQVIGILSLLCLGSSYFLIALLTTK